MTSRLRQAAFLFIAIAAPLLALGEAEAASKLNCTVTSVGFSDGGIGSGISSVQFACSDGTLMSASTASQPGSPACPHQSADAIKVWAGMLQSALLGGKLVDIFYTQAFSSSFPSCSVNSFSSLTLK